MKILRIKTDGTREYAEISGELKTLQAEVGGHIEPVYLDNGMVLICDEEGLLKDKPVSVAIADSISGRVFNTIHGDCFICGLSKEDFAGLTDEQVRWLDVEMITDAYVWDETGNDLFRKVAEIWV